MTDDLISEIKTPRTNGSIITVVGVGGAGGNAVNHMWNLGIRGVTFMVCNTDRQALDKSPVELKICLGSEGLGAGNDPENGRRAAVETLPEIRQQLEEAGTKMIFITAGMGGGTGTGASPVIAKLAREMGLLTVAIVTSPLAVEGKIRYEQAFRGIEELRQNVDSLLIINNENIREIYGRLSLKQAFGKADDILASATKGIAEIITVESDLVNVDFADVSKVMHDSGRAHMAVATAEGENRAEAAAEASLHSPLLDHNQISGAKDILLNISVANAEQLMYDEVLRILVATGFEDEARAGVMRQIIPPARKIEPAQPEQPEPSGLEPIKPGAPSRVAPRQPEQVVLGARSTRYSDIDRLLAKPAYRSRNAQFVVQTPGGRKEGLGGALRGPSSSSASCRCCCCAFRPSSRAPKPLSSPFRTTTCSG